MRYFIQYAIGLLLAVLLAGCGSGTAVRPTTTTAPNALPAGATMQLALAASEVAVGENRFPVGLIMQGTPANDPKITIHLTFKHTTNEPDKIRSEADAVYRGQGLPVGLYVAEATFDQPGDWNVLAKVDKGDGQPVYLNPMRFTVLEKAVTPAVGSPAPPSANLTVRDQPDLKKLTSDYAPDAALYQMTITEALAAKKPFVVLFATPGYCQTATCGPNIQVIKKFQHEFSQQLNFIHVEVYPYPFNESFEQRKVVQSMADWKLSTEPWTFLVDGQGIIKGKYEGGITLTELEPVLKNLAAGS
jgi:hypothetical protein